MSLRYVLCEGPDDLTALREIGLHLWCALVDEKATELNVAARVLHQNTACRPHALDVLREAGVLADLQPLFT